MDDALLKMSVSIAEEMDVTLCQWPNVDYLPLEMSVSTVEEMDITLCQWPNVDYVDE